MKVTPDIIIFLTDQWNSRMLGCAGDEVVQTPAIDRLAVEGTRFVHSYTTSPVCMPARCSLASGRYPHNLGLWFNMTDYCCPPHHLSLFRQTKAAGYSTAQIGKFHYSSIHSLSSPPSAFKPDGWHEMIAMDHAQQLPEPYAVPWERSEYTEHLKRKGLLRPYLDDLRRRYCEGDHAVIAPAPVPPEDHPDGYIGQQAEKYVQNHPVDTPMFLVVSFPGPHSPFDAPGAYAELFHPEDMALAANVPETVLHQYGSDHVRHAQANYYGKIKLIDDCIGRIIDVQRQRGKWDETLAVFTADHGEYMGSHGRFSKCGFHEESARIPLIVRWPAAGDMTGAHRGNSVDALVELIDVYATAIDAAGGDPGPDTFGRSLLPFARDPQTEFRTHVLSEIGNRGNLNYMVRDARFKWFVSNGREHLFDLRNDPFEMTDLVNDPQSRPTIRDLKDQLRDILMQTQLNDAATYQSLFQRIGQVTSPEGLDRFLDNRFDEIHFSE